MTIHNLWVLQFGGTSDAALLVRVPSYIPDFVSGTTEQVLNTDVGGASTIVFLANTFRPDLKLGTYGQTTLGEFKKKYLPAPDETALFSACDGKLYQRLSGQISATIDTDSEQLGTVLSPIPLKRSISRLDIYVKSSLAAITVDRIQLCNLPSRDYLFTSYSLPQTFPAETHQMQDYPAAAFSSGTSTADGRYFRYYVAANKRGTAQGTVKKKNYEAPYGATYLRVDATYDNSGTPEQLRYYFYLGAYDDFNLLPNYSYTYKIDIRAVGDAATDSRVEYYPSEVDFSSEEKANSYILHVSPDAEKSTVFTVPVAKADLFWANAVYSSRAEDSSRKIFVRQYNNVDMDASQMVLGSDGAWTAEILWSDFPISDGQVQLKAQGDGTWRNGDTPSASSGAGLGAGGSFQLKVKGGVKGNFVVGIRKNLDYGEGTIPTWVWSWHFWVTDYNPDAVVGQTAPSSAHFFYVRGGKLVRYGLEDEWMMDRPLGAVYDLPVPSFHNARAQGGETESSLGLFYQFGRKDPFPNDRDIYIRGAAVPSSGLTDITSSNAVTVLGTDSGMAKVLRSNMKQEWSAHLFTEGSLNVAFSICHPMTYIYDPTKYWELGTSSFPSRFNPAVADNHIIWMDPLAMDRNSDAQLGSQKSVFDPCPPGWKVPVRPVNVSSWVLSEHIHEAVYYSPMGDAYPYGAYLFPEAKPSPITESALDQGVLYVFEGSRLGSDGTMVNTYNTVSDAQNHCWTALVASSTEAYSVDLKTSSFSGTAMFQSNGHTVRCVKY